MPKHVLFVRIRKLLWDRLYEKASLRVVGKSVEEGNQIKQSIFVGNVGL